MTNKVFAAALAAVLLLVGVHFLVVNPVVSSVDRLSESSKVGGTVNYSNAQSNANLYTTLESLLSDIINTRSSIAGIDNGVTAAIDFPALATSTWGIATTTVVTGLVAGLGDPILVFPTTFTASTTYSGYVTVASTTSATVAILGQAVGSASAVDPASSVFTVIRLSSSTFATPAALNTASSTSN